MSLKLNVMQGKHFSRYFVLTGHSALWLTSVVTPTALTILYHFMMHAHHLKSQVTELTFRKLIFTLILNCLYQYLKTQDLFLTYT